MSNCEQSIDECYSDGGIADRIYDVLVEACGARESNRDYFAQSFANGSWSEFRFNGKLDFGGKFWRNNNRFYVSCYSENMNDERRVIIDRANEQLAAIRATVEGNW